MALSWVKTYNTFKDLLNKTRQIVYSLYWAKGINKKKFKDTKILLIQFSIKINTIFMISEKSRTSDPCRSVLNLADKVNLKRTEYSYKNNNFEISAPTVNDEFELSDQSYSVLDIQND